MNTRVISVIMLLATGLLSACSTVTPYTLDIAADSTYAGKLSAAEAVSIVKKARVSGEDADARSFVVDEEGFSYVKTSEETRTEWKDKKPVEKKSTLTLTRNVPWGAVTRLSPYLQQYKAVLPDAYRLELEFSTKTVKNSSRVSEKHDISIYCKNYDELVDLVAALRVLTDL
ncbi:MAG: hypothetical protein KJ626_03225 [Verrucomicrobia bacterium]|nr:hypothetical protein [Verrucomicrobiota bacterium]